MNQTVNDESEIVKFPGIASISLSITPIQETTDMELIEAIVRVYDENNEQIMRQKARSLLVIAKNLKLFIQAKTNLPINDRRMATWLADYLTHQGIKVEEEVAYQTIKKASQTLEKVSKVKIEYVEPSDLVSIETDVLASLITLKSDHLMSEDELFNLLEKHQTPTTNKVLRIISYVNSGGVEHKDTITLTIEPTNDPFIHSLVGSFKNESEKELTNLKITDLIPYAFKMIDAISSEGGKHAKELIENGLNISWKISKITPGKEIKINYSFERRIPRTIYIRKGEEIRIVHDYNSLLSEEAENGLEEKYFISEVINLLPVTLDELIIRDLLPPDLTIKDSSITDEMRFIDFGQIYGKNIQITHSTVETGKKFLQKISIEPSPVIWKIDVNASFESDGEAINAYLTKILEKVPNTNFYVCSIVASAPLEYKVINPLESGLQVQDYLPSTLIPSITSNELIWDAEEKFAISFVLQGNLTTQPLSPKLNIRGKDYTVLVDKKGPKRESKILSIPFNHVALYRKASRIEE